MKALTICEPYATLIMTPVNSGGIIAPLKRIENRTWPAPSYLIGQRFAIHAGKSKKYLDTYKGPLPAPLTFGAVLGTVVLSDCWHIDDVAKLPERLAWVRTHEHTVGPWLWILEDPVRWHPYPCSGAQGLWELKLQKASS